MKLFTCECGQIIYFESKTCTSCGKKLAFLPQQRVMSALEPAAVEGEYMALHPNASAAGQTYRLCQNELDHGVCSWAVPAADPQRLCFACRLNQTIPNVSKPEAKRAWERLETAKRRMLYTLLDLELPIETHLDMPEGGLAFAFKESGKHEKVFTGQANGLITINLDEASDPQREKIREQMGEAYRTLVGHFRHEVGHFYWDRLIRDSNHLPACRALFGDESIDYQAAIDRHYKQGPPADWPAHYVSAYATMHPWEDWAETWAHYLHMVDTLDTARSYGLVVVQQPIDGPPFPSISIPHTNFDDFDSLVVSFLPLTLALNSLDRSMGHPDSYPFVLSDPALEKLRFVHQLALEVRQHASTAARAAGQNDACAPTALN